jgi:acyl-CoA synthetase (AMP-forming)/AMP-acid ligase II
MFDSGANLATILWHAADLDGARTFIRDRDNVVSLDALRNRASAIAEGLLADGVGPGDRVAIFIERGVDAIASLFGVYAAGAVAVVLNDRYRPRQVEYVLDHCGAAALLTTNAMLDRLHRDLVTTAPLLDPDTLPASASFTPVRRIDPDLAQIIYTSGSTGMPKGVTFNLGALHAGVRAVSSYLGLQADDRVATLLSFGSVYGLNQVLTAVACGASVIIERSALPQQMVAGLADHGATVLAAVPPLWIQLLGVPSFQEGALTGLRVAQNAGGHLPPEIVRQVRAALPRTRLFLQYGMTETFRSSYLPPEELDRRPGSMGRAMPDTEILILDDDEQPVPDGEVGELVHRGPTIALGYWNDPETSRNTFRPNPMRPAGAPDTERVVFSGDMVRRDAEGFLYYVSRRDRLIKTMGFRVGPDEIADAVYASGQVLETVIDSEPDEERGARIVAYVVLRDSGSIDRLKRFCRAELPEYSQPAKYIERADLPRLAGGKHDLDALRRAHAVSA